MRARSLGPPSPSADAARQRRHGTHRTIPAVRGSPGTVSACESITAVIRFRRPRDLRTGAQGAGGPDARAVLSLVGPGMADDALHGTESTSSPDPGRSQQRSALPAFEVPGFEHHSAHTRAHVLPRLRRALDDPPGGSREREKNRGGPARGTRPSRHPCGSLLPEAWFDRGHCGQAPIQPWDTGRSNRSVRSGSGFRAPRR